MMMKSTSSGCSHGQEARASTVDRWPLAVERRRRVEAGVGTRRYVTAEHMQ